MTDRLLTPQQELFLASYTDPKSETFGNAKQSALKAKYTEEYSDNIMSLMPDWLSENIASMRSLKRAERNLEQVQEISIFDDEGRVKTDVLRERNKVDLFVAETVGRAKYSKRSELSGPNGGAIKLQQVTGMRIINDSDKTNDDRQA